MTTGVEILQNGAFASNRRPYDGPAKTPAVVTDVMQTVAVDVGPVPMSNAGDAPIDLDRLMSWMTSQMAAAVDAGSIPMSNDGRTIGAQPSKLGTLMSLITLLTQCLQGLIKNREAGNAQSALLSESVQSSYQQRAQETRSAGDQEFLGAIVCFAAVVGIASLGAALAFKGASKDIEIDSRRSQVDPGLPARSPARNEAFDQEGAPSGSVGSSGQRRPSVLSDSSQTGSLNSQGGASARTRREIDNADSNPNSNPNAAGQANRPPGVDVDEQRRQEYVEGKQAAERRKNAGTALLHMPQAVGGVMSSGWHVGATGARANADLLQASSSSTETAKQRLDDQARGSDGALNRTQAALHDVLESNEQVQHKIAMAIAA